MRPPTGGSGGGQQRKSTTATQPEGATPAAAPLRPPPAAAAAAAGLVDQEQQPKRPEAAAPAQLSDARLRAGAEVLAAPSAGKLLLDPLKKLDEVWRLVCVLVGEGMTVQCTPPTRSAGLTRTHTLCCAAAHLPPCRCAPVQMHVANKALAASLSELRVRAAMQAARTVRLANPLLEARMQALARRVLRQEEDLARSEAALAGMLQGGGGGGAAGGGEAA